MNEMSLLSDKFLEEDVMQHLIRSLLWGKVLHIACRVVPFHKWSSCVLRMDGYYISEFQGDSWAWNKFVKKNKSY